MGVWDSGLKVFLLLIGIWEFTPWFPASLDLFDKVLTSLILLYFWFKFGTSDFVLGKKSKFLNTAILIGFYILSLDTFVQFAAQVGKVNDGLLSLLGFHISVEGISLFSLYAGIIILILIAVYAAFRVQLGSKSFIHSVWSLSVKKAWAKVSEGKGLWRLARFFVVLFGLLVVSQYFFHLVTQWFVVSLDKSLLIVSFLFAIKDLEHSKVEALHTLGNLDDIVLNTVRRLFTTPSTFFIGIGALLMFHVLSDLSVFFIPYLFGLSFDPFYLSAIGSPDRHTALFTLFSAEPSSGFFIAAAYVLSALGVLLTLTVPILFCVLVGTKTSLGRLVEKLWFRIAIILSTLLALFFLMTPWVKQQAISAPGIYGVDFVTHALSSVSIAPLHILVISFFALLFFGIIFSRKLSSYAIIALFFASFVYIGTYIWTFFASSVEYYLSDIISVASLGFTSLTLIFGLLMVVDLLFYLGGFMIFTYYSAKYLVENFEQDLLHDSVALSMSLMIVLLSMLFIYLQNVVLLGIALAVGCLFNLGFFVHLKGKKEFRDDFMLAVSVLIASFVVVTSLSVLFGVSASAMSLIGPVLITIIAFELIKFFRLSISFSRKYINIKYIIVSALLALVFAVCFYFVGEPVPELLSYSIFGIFIFSAVVALAEELFFRFILLRLAEKGFGWTKAVVIQAVLFPLIHLLDIRSYLSFGIWHLIIYIALLALFAGTASLLVGKSQSKSKYSGNVVYAIVLHLLTNFFMILAVQ